MRVILINKYLPTVACRWSKNVQLLFVSFLNVTSIFFCSVDSLASEQLQTPLTQNLIEQMKKMSLRMVFLLAGLVFGRKTKSSNQYILIRCL